MVIAAAFLLLGCNRPVRTPAPVFVLDESGIVRRVNRAAENAVDSALDKVDPPKKDDGAFSKF